MQFHASMLIFQREKVSKEDKDKRTRRKVVESPYLATMLNLLTRLQAYSFLIDLSLFPLYPSTWKFHSSHENIYNTIEKYTIDSHYISILHTTFNFYIFTLILIFLCHDFFEKNFRSISVLLRKYPYCFIFENKTIYSSLYITKNFSIFL